MSRARGGLARGARRQLPAVHSAGRLSCLGQLDHRSFDFRSIPICEVMAKVTQSCAGLFSKATPAQDVTKLKPGIALPHVTLPTTEVGWQ